MRPTSVPSRHHSRRILRRGLEQAIVDAPRPYRLVVLSDHGQSQGETFRDAHGVTLDELVRGLVAPSTPVHGSVRIDEGWAALSGALTESMLDDSPPSRLTRRTMRSRTVDGQVILGPERAERQQADTDPKTPEVVVPDDGRRQDRRPPSEAAGATYDSHVTKPTLGGRYSMERFTRLSENLFRFTDSCNAYLVKDRDVGLLIDAGSGACLDHLDEVGVERIEWVLHTHHHRDQCWGTPRLREHGANVAVPEYERHLFDQADLFWQTRRTYDNYDDRNTFFTVGEPIEVDAVLEDYEEFAWRDYRFFVLPAKGHTYGSSTLLAEIDGQRVAFTGDLMVDGGALYQLHAMEYMYSGLEGLAFTLQSIQALSRREPALALPSHGEPISDVRGDINRLERRITDCVRLGRGMHVGGIWSRPESNFLPGLKLIPLSRHLLWGGIWACSNFYILLSDSGKALFVDYGTSNLAHLHIHADHEGLESMRFVEHRLDALCEDYGVTEIEVVIPTHIHDDHTCGIPYLQRFHGTECWALDQVAQVIEQPADWASTPCVYPKPIRVDRTLTDGESFSWKEYDFEIFHAPGQTEFHSVIVTDVDGKRVAFTGDNWQADEVIYEGRSKVSAFQTTVMRNSFQLGMHRKCAEVMRRVNPELICPGHNDVLDCTKGDVDSYCDFIEQKERAFRRLVAEPADHYIDLFWARLLPYLTTAQSSETVSFRILLRNNLERSATYAARLLPAHGWTSEDEWGEARLEPGERGEIELRATAPPEGDGTRRLLTAEIAIDGETQGPISEALVTVTRAGLA